MKVLVVLAEQRLPKPHMLMVQGWDDGDFDVFTHHTETRLTDHNRDYDAETIKIYERIEYDHEREAIVHGRVVTDEDRDEVIERDEIVLEEYECPVPVVE